MSPADRTRLLDGLVVAALEAGLEVWTHFNRGVEVMTKDDLSPVTAADQAAEAIILRALARLAPETPVVAEEEAAALAATGTDSDTNQMIERLRRIADGHKS